MKTSEIKTMRVFVRLGGGELAARECTVRVWPDGSITRPHSDDPSVDPFTVQGRGRRLRGWGKYDGPSLEVGRLVVPESEWLRVGGAIPEGVD